MNKYDILILLYRDLYFWEKYGSAVRDLQILEIISDLNFFENISVLNRPVSIYERLWIKINKNFNYPNIKVLDSTSFDLLGPLKKRLWTKNCYNKEFLKFIDNKKSKNQLIVLDFTPIAILPIKKNNSFIYWHDMIDNFTKHNRFSDKDKKLVQQKYDYVAKNYDMLSSVTSAAATEIVQASKIQHVVIPNGVFNTKFSKSFRDIKFREIYDLGFIGFVTNKLDLDLVTRLSKKYKIVFYGKVLDKTIGKHLKKNGIVLKGEFRYTELPEIIKTFKCGLIPYLSNKSHDGSPLKLYEYLKFNLPCVTTIDYEFTSEFVLNSEKSMSIYDDIDNLIIKSGNSNISNSLPFDVYLKFNVYKFISKICN
jgi:hypothetical protein